VVAPSAWKASTTGRARTRSRNRPESRSRARNCARLSAAAAAPDRAMAAMNGIRVASRMPAQMGLATAAMAIITSGTDGGHAGGQEARDMAVQRLDPLDQGGGRLRPLGDGGRRRPREPDRRGSRPWPRRRPGRSASPASRASRPARGRKRRRPAGTERMSGRRPLAIASIANARPAAKPIAARPSSSTNARALRIARPPGRLARSSQAFAPCSPGLGVSSNCTMTAPMA
jgi:hypothetical protein